MTKTRVYWGFLAMLIIPCAVFGEFYKCDVDGKTVYSDKKCRTGDAQEIEVDTRSTGFDLNPYYESEDNKLLKEYREKNRRRKLNQGVAAERYEQNKKRDSQLVNIIKQK